MPFYLVLPYPDSVYHMEIQHEMSSNNQHGGHSVP